MHRSHSALSHCCVSEHLSRPATDSAAEGSVHRVNSSGDFEIIDVDPSSGEESWVRLDVSAYQRRQCDEAECAPGYQEEEERNNGNAERSVLAPPGVVASQAVSMSAPPEPAIRDSAPPPSHPGSPLVQSTATLPMSPIPPVTASQSCLFARWFGGLVQNAPPTTMSLPMYRRECECLGARYGFHRVDCPHDPFKRCHCIGAAVNIHRLDCTRGSSVV